MAFGLNRAEVIGRLGADVTINHLASGGRVANLSIATDESYIDKQTGERVDRTEWHRVVTFQNGLVDMFEKHAKKGRLVYVAGKLQTRKWRKDGEDGDRFSTEILLVPGGRVQFLDKPAGANGNGAPASNGEAIPARRRPVADDPARPQRRYPLLNAGSSLPRPLGPVPRLSLRGTGPFFEVRSRAGSGRTARLALRASPAVPAPARAGERPEPGRSPGSRERGLAMFPNSAHRSGFAGAVMRARRAP